MKRADDALRALADRGILQALKDANDRAEQAERERADHATMTAAFAPYLKDGETPIERLDRERHDNDLLLGLLAKEKAHVEMVERVEGQRVAARDKEIIDLQIELSLADRDRDAARADRDRFQRERDEARAACDRHCAELRAMLTEVRDWLAVLESDVDDIDVMTHGEMLAKLEAILRDQPQDSGYRLVSLDTIGKLRAVLVDPANEHGDDLIREIDTLEGR